MTRLPYAIAARLPALPLMLRGGRLVVALEDPSRRLAVDEIEFAAQCKVVPVLARTGLLQGAIDAAYEKLGAIDYAMRQASDAAAALDFEPEDAGKLLATLEQQHSSDTAKADDEDDRVIEQSDNSLVRLINTHDPGSARAERQRHPHRDPARAREGAHPLPQGRPAAALHGAAAHLPQRR